MQQFEANNVLGEKKPLVTAEVVAAFLGLHVDTVYRWTREGILPVRRLRGQLRYDLDAVEKAVIED